MMMVMTTMSRRRRGYLKTVLLNLILLPTIATTAHCELWPVKQYPSIFPYLSSTLSIFSLPEPEDLFLRGLEL